MLDGQSQRCAAANNMLVSGPLKHRHGGTYLRTSCGADGEREQLRGMLVAIKFQFGEGGSVTFNWLTDSPFPAVQLDVAFNLERRWIGGVA